MLPNAVPLQGWVCWYHTRAEDAPDSVFFVYAAFAFRDPDANSDGRVVPWVDTGADSGFLPADSLGTRDVTYLGCCYEAESRNEASWWKDLWASTKKGGRDDDDPDAAPQGAVSIG